MEKENKYDEYHEQNTTYKDYGYGWLTIETMSAPQRRYVHPDTGEVFCVGLPTRIYARELAVEENSPEFDLARRFLSVNQPEGSLEEGQAQIEAVLDLVRSPLSEDRTNRRTVLPFELKQRYVAVIQLIAYERAQQERR